MISAHALQILIPDCDDGCIRGVIPALMLGFSYSTFSSILWSHVARVVENRLLGTAFGLYTLVVNIEFCFTPVIVGWLQEHTAAQQGFMWSEIFFGIMGFCALICNLMMYGYDLKSKKAEKTNKRNEILD